jgi:hypothetical protein
MLIFIYVFMFLLAAWAFLGMPMLLLIGARANSEADPSSQLKIIKAMLWNVHMLVHMGIWYYLFLLGPERIECNLQSWLTWDMVAVCAL